MVIERWRRQRRPPRLQTLGGCVQFGAQLFQRAIHRLAVAHPPPQSLQAAAQQRAIANETVSQASLQGNENFFHGDFQSFVWQSFSFVQNINGGQLAPKTRADANKIHLRNPFLSRTFGDGRRGCAPPHAQSRLLDVQGFP